MQTGKQKLIIAFFALYILALVWIIVFKLQLSFNSLPDEQGINLIPFYDPNIERVSIYIGEKIYNMLLFVPFGLYVCLLKKDWSLGQKLTPIFLTSLAFELIQWVFSIGSADITDLIQNTLGGALGIGIFYLFRKISKGKSYKIVSILALVLTVLMMVFIGLLKTFIKIKLN